MSTETNKHAYEPERAEKNEPAKAPDNKNAKKPAPRRKASFAVVEAYKTIRTNIQFLLAQKDGKIVSISSAGAGEGKSTTAVNLAITFSQMGGKVLLIDGDMRRSSVHKKLKLDNKDGLSNVLAGFSTPEQAIVHINDNLDVLLAGPYPPNPSELLASVRFEEFVTQCRDIYDYVFIDSPPISVVADALVLAPKTDGIIFVARDFVTPVDALRHVVDAAKFANINVLGTILNGIDAKRSRRYSYRRYAYGGKGHYGGYGGYGYGKGYSGYKGYNYGGGSGYSGYTSYGGGYGGYGGYGGGYGGYGGYVGYGGGYGGYGGYGDYSHSYERADERRRSEEKKQNKD